MAKKKIRIALGWKHLVAGFILVIIIILVGTIWRDSTLSDLDLQKWAGVASLFQGGVGFLILAPIIWAVVKYRQVAEDQRKAKHYQAWQAISDAQGKSGSGGRIDALQDLHKDGVILAGVDLSGGAYLAEIQLPGAWMGKANLKGALLFRANLKGALIPESNLQEARLESANLQEADLIKANLQDADLVCANLQGAFLKESNLQEADLYGANLQRAYLVHAELQGADLRRANLEGAYLNFADFSSTRNLTREQILSAGDREGAKLPEHLKDLELPADASPPEDQE